MDFSKFKVELYDFFAVIIPGLFVLLESWITLRGWHGFIAGVSGISASSFTILLLAAFALGPLVQEIADLSIKTLRGSRFFKHSRDHLWNTPTGAHVRARIEKELGHHVESVDVAFDYCLSRIQGVFAKRDLFIANSDLARGMIVVVILGLAPVVRITIEHATDLSSIIYMLAAEIAVLFFIASIFWIRMKRFRELSETPVFHAYLATLPETKIVANAAK